MSLTNQITPEIISRLNNLSLKARLVVEGFIVGLHQSPFHGFSVEFAQHRSYTLGDEIKHIDLDVFRKLYAEISSHYYSNPAEKIKKLNTIKKILMYFDPNSEITLWKRYASRFIYSMVYIHYSKKVDIVKFIEKFHEDVQAYIQNMISKMEKRFRNSYDSESKILSVLKKQLIEDEKIIL